MRDLLRLIEYIVTLECFWIAILLSFVAVWALRGGCASSQLA